MALKNNNVALVIKLIYTVFWSVLLFVATFSNIDKDFFHFHQQWGDETKDYFFKVFFVWLAFLIDEIYSVLKQYKKAKTVVNHAVVVLIGQFLFMIFFALSLKFWRAPFLMMGWSVLSFVKYIVTENIPIKDAKQVLRLPVNN